MSFISGGIDITALSAANPTEVFILPSDVDAISEITLQMSLGADGSGVSSTFLLDIIRKIEIKVGNLVVQTILPGDIYSRNLTESGSALNINTLQTLDGSGIYAVGDNIDYSLSIPFTGRSTGVNRSFLQAGAITNSLTMKVYYNSLSGSTTQHLAAGYPASITTGVCVVSHTMTSTEKNFITKNIVNRPVNTSQSIVAAIESAPSAPFTIDLSSININVSHILLTLNNNLFKSSGISVNKASGATGTTWSPKVSGVMAATDLGVAIGWLKSAELVLGNDRTGAIPGSCLATNKLELFELTSVASKNIYVLKLAGSAFSTAGIPFSRLNNKKLILNFATGFTVAPYADSGNKGITNINVTCCGTQVQSTVGGTISFSA
jgi:hypothetical protein